MKCQVKHLTRKEATIVNCDVFYLPKRLWVQKMDSAHLFKCPPFQVHGTTTTVGSSTIGKASSASLLATLLSWCMSKKYGVMAL